MGSDSISNSKHIRGEKSGADLVYTDPESQKRAAITFSFVPLHLQTHQHLIKVFYCPQKQFQQIIQEGKWKAAV